MSVEGWKTGKLRDITVINYGKSPVKILSPEGQYPVVGTGETERLGTNFLYDGESIILGRKGSIDRVYFASGKFWAIDTAYYLSDFRETFPRWLFYYLQTIDLRQMNEATGVPSLSREFLYNIALQIPAKAEQTQIATILSTIDRAIEQTEALIAKQQRIKTGLMQDLLTKGIDENGNIRSEETHEFKDSPLGRIPVEWEVSAGYNYFTLHSGINVNGIQRESDNHILYLKVEDFNNPENRDGIVITENTFNCPDHLISQLLEPGTIVFPKRGAAIFLNRVSYLRKRATLDPNIMGLRTKSGISSEFLHLVLLYKNLGTICDNSGIPQINNKHLYPLIVAVPAIDEQERIVVNFRQIQKLLHDICVQLAKLRSLKTGLMQDLLTGKVRVTDLLNQKTAVN